MNAQCSTGMPKTSTLRGIVQVVSLDHTGANALLDLFKASATHTSTGNHLRQAASCTHVNEVTEEVNDDSLRISQLSSFGT